MGDSILNIHLDPRRMRIICRWTESRQVVVNKSQGVLAKVRGVSVRISTRGRLNRQDFRKCADHPTMPIILSFVEAMKAQQCFPLREDTLNPCELCGERGEAGGTFPYYDPAQNRVVWLCQEHRHLVGGATPGAQGIEAGQDLYREALSA